MNAVPESRAHESPEAAPPRRAPHPRWRLIVLGITVYSLLIVVPVMLADPNQDQAAPGLLGNLVVFGWWSLLPISFIAGLVIWHRVQFAILGILVTQMLAAVVTVERNLHSDSPDNLVGLYYFLVGGLVIACCFLGLLGAAIGRSSWFGRLVGSRLGGR